MQGDGDLGQQASEHETVDAQGERADRQDEQVHGSQPPRGDGLCRVLALSGG